jgi:hypothetical protein
MKKTFFLTTIICFLIATVNAQLAGTKWSGTANLLQPDKSLVTADITWDFGKDTIYVLFAGGGQPEILTYTTKKNMITMTKVSGGSPCETGAEGKLKYEIKDDKLFLTLAETKCEAFTKALDGKPYTKIK